jgi:integrase/recombinase XerD
VTDLELSGRVLPATPDSDTDRVTQLTAAWLARRAPNTRREYRRDLGHWLAWCDRCAVDPLAARMMHMDAWIAWQRTYGVNTDSAGRDDTRNTRDNPRAAGAASDRGAQPPGQRPAAEASIARRVAAVSSWYKYLYRNTKDDDVPLAVTNPADTDGRPIIDPDSSLTVGLSTAEADRLCKAADADGPRSSALIRLLLYGGLRCGSALDAAITDLGHDRGYRTLTVRMKGGKIRRVPIVPALGDAIDAYLAARGHPREGLLFVTRTGRRVGEPYLYDLVRRLARNAGIPSSAHLSPHSLRHTFATDYLDAGGNLRDLQDAMGHADPRTTRRYDRSRHNLDRHPAHVLAIRYGARKDT